jgi:hypothetical protein
VLWLLRLSGPEQEQVLQPSALVSNGRVSLGAPSDKHLLEKLTPNPGDPDTSGISFLLTNLQVTLSFLDKMDTLRSTASVLAVQRHARRTYDEVIGLLQLLTISDADRLHIEERINLLRLRLIQLGEELET